MIYIKSSSEIEVMRQAGAIVAAALDLAESRIRTGLRTADIDQEVAEFIYKKNARPAFKGFHGYPANICISINEQVVHGIPGDRMLQNGDIVSIDIGVELNGYFGDGAKTFTVGAVSDEKSRLLQVTQEALYKGIEMARESKRLFDISHAIQHHVENAGYSVVRDLVGHGIGQHLHEAPQIPNFGRKNQGPRLKAGMVFAIEPMVNMGHYEVITKEDSWTVVAKDGKPSAHFEHTILVTQDEPEILTKTNES
jgi:methionyl aminopeptidase